jgi:hypothetical protein
VHGRVVPVRDAQALAGAIVDVLRLASEPDLPQACRRYAEERYCATRIAQSVLSHVSESD